jgi:ATP-dependent Clp protease protease subunit
LDEEIDDKVASSITGQLLFLDMQSPGTPIKMLINSVGGSLVDGLAIIDTMQHIKSPVETIAIGKAYSMASIILISGGNNDKGKNGCKRKATKSSRIMLHQPILGLPESKVSDMEIAVKEGKYLKEYINKIIVEKTGMSKETVEKLLENDFYMSAEEAKEMNIIDCIVGEDQVDI